MKNLAMLNESTFTGAASGGNYSFDFSGLFAGMQRSFDSTVAGYRDSLAEELETMQRDVLAARAEYTDSLSIEATAMADLETAATELTAAQDAYINGTETEKEGLAALVTAAEETYTANRTAAETATAARQAEEAQHAAAEKSYADRLRLAAEVAEATGDEAAAADILIMQRHLEIDAMDASSRSLQQLQWDMDATAAEAERFAANIAALENSMNEWITGLRSALTDAAQAYMSRLVEELNELENNYSNAKNAYMSGLQQEISLLNERAASSESAYRTGLSMSQALAEAMGDEAAAAEILEKSRAMELAAMDESLRPMQEMMWALEDSESTMADYAAGINSIQGAIDSIMGGDATSVQSSDYFNERYDELLAAAQADPAKAGEFAAFSKQYLDFIEDYGDPKAREKVLKDLWSVEEGYVEDQLDAADQTNVNLIDMTEVMEELSGLEQGYLSAIDARDDNWYQSALDNFTDTKSILTLQQEYNAAKTALDNSTHAETIAELQGILGAGKTTAVLLEEYLKAKSGAAAGDTLVDIYDAVTGLWDNLAEGPLGGIWDFFFPGGGGSVVDPGDSGGGGSVVDPGNDGGGGSVIHPADTHDGVPDDWNGYIDGVSWADKYVQDLYATVGRGPDIGSAVDQIDQRGYNYWREKGKYGEYSSLLADFRSAISSYLETNDYEITLPGTLANYVKNHNTLGLNTGGSFAVNGPSGLDNLYLPQMRVTAGEIVNVTRGDVMAELLREIRAINSSGNGGGDTSIKVYIGDRELRDLTTETLRTDQQAQQVIRRAAHV